MIDTIQSKEVAGKTIGVQTSNPILCIERAGLNFWWCGWCVNEGYLEAHYAQRASAMAPLPEDDGRKPGDQQAWTSEQRHALTRHVDQQARDAVEAYTTLPEDY